MQREILHGVPYFLKGNDLYMWNSPSMRIGTYDPHTKQVSLESLDQLHTQLQQWRSEQHPRARNPSSTNSTNSANSADSANPPIS